MKFYCILKNVMKIVIMFVHRAFDSVHAFPVPVKMSIDNNNN